MNRERLNIYGLYRKNKLVVAGTAKEIAEHEGIKTSTVYSYMFMRNQKISDSLNVRVENMSRTEYENSIKLEKIMKLYFMGFSYWEAIELTKGWELEECKSGIVS